MPWWDAIAFYKRITIIAVAISSVVAASIAVANVLQAGEPHWIATRSFVRETVAEVQAKSTLAQKKLEQQQIQTEVQVLQSRIEAIKSKISDRELLLQKQEGPAEYRQLVQEQINGYKDALDRLGKQLEQIRPKMN